MNTMTSKENTNQPAYLLLTDAIGDIQAGAEQQERLDEIIERLKSDEFFVAVDQLIPSKCIDGRVGANGFAPNAAGGTESLMVADDLTYQRFIGSSTLESFANVVNELQTSGMPVGGHTAEGAAAPGSGCGANDKLEVVYAFITAHGPMLRELATSLGVSIDDATAAIIHSNAMMRSNFSDGSELLTVLETAVGTNGVDVLQGDHNEVVAVINKRSGTTLERTKLEAEFGSQYEAFNVDVWSFPDAAAAVAEFEEHVAPLVAAMTVYNLAVAHVLCGPNMRVIVRE